MIFCSYYTLDGYAGEARNLRLSLEKFKINYRFKSIKSKGTWLENVKYKPKFILDMLNEHKCPVVWIDADSIVRQTPTVLFYLANSDADFAAHWRDDSQLLSGTLFFNVTGGSQRLLAEWVRLTLEFKDWTDQAVLQHVIEVNLVPDLKIDRLPASYCQIFDTMAHNGDPVIEHFQASRKYKRR